MADTYRRPPLPATARSSVGWFALCWFLLIFSPFVGFALHGKVDERGLEMGLAFALIPLAGLTALAARRWRNWRAVPPALRAQWDAGWVVPAEGAPAVAAPVRFTQGKRWIEMRPDGVVFARNSLLGMQGVPRLIEATWVAEQAGQWFVPWADITEWVVETDSDGPDNYRLLLRQGQMRLQRLTPDAGHECDVLDAVRAVGRCPVRLRCDVG
ncbi:MAG: hypothetical protein QM569_01105 [Acidovorax sp.]|uniref:hypothetical protein n=1 Tax=Acidovorax sp. TaxID=1872122 RepID=UPI0039E61E61